MAISKSPDKANATYQDILDAPEDMIAEILDGDLYLSPRPAGPHQLVASVLTWELGRPFHRGHGGPGGWIILYEPEVKLAVATPTPRTHVLVPDLVGWRRERMPVVENVPSFELRPDWVCEVASPSTRWRDRTKKLAIYAAAEVPHVWLVEPIARTLEVLERAGVGWTRLAHHAGDVRVRIPPFDAIELDLSVLWADLGAIGPIVAGEQAAEYLTSG